SARAHPVRVPRTAPRRQARSRPAVLIALLRAGEFGGVGVLEGAVALDRVGELAVEAGALHALLGDDALLLEQVRVLRLQPRQQRLGNRLARELEVVGLAEQRHQAAAQVLLAHDRSLERVVQQGQAFAVGVAQVLFGGIRLDHRHVAAALRGGRQSVGDGLLLARGGGGDFLVGEGAPDFAGGASGGGVDLGAGQFDRARRQRVAAGALAVFFPAVQLLAAL